MAKFERAHQSARRLRLAVRREWDDRLVASWEMVLPGDKDDRPSVDRFGATTVASSAAGAHVHLLDLLQPGPFDPGGMHTAIGSRVGHSPRPHSCRPLAVASYVVNGGAIDCHATSIAVGEALVDTPFFLTPAWSVNVPMEVTYAAAYVRLPRHVMRVLEA